MFEAHQGCLEAQQGLQSHEAHCRLRVQAHHDLQLLLFADRMIGQEPLHYADKLLIMSRFALLDCCHQAWEGGLERLHQQCC